MTLGQGLEQEEILRDFLANDDQKARKSWDMALTLEASRVNVGKTRRWRGDCADQAEGIRAAVIATGRGGLVTSSPRMMWKAAGAWYQFRLFLGLRTLTIIDGHEHQSTGAGQDRWARR